MPDIKRYPNRKLYDTEAKRYVTLEDITEMIRADQDIHVTDHESGDDLTTLTLTQIILEQEKKASGFLPRSLLTSLIRTGGDTLEQVVRSLQATLPVSSQDNAIEGSDAEEGDVAHEETTEIVEPETNDKSTHSSIVDDRVSDMFHLLNVPTRRDMRQLQEQINMLNSRLEELSVEAAPADGEERAAEEDANGFADCA
jgi:polyhydroxyalkanoate synthesis repressor PhaR